MNSDQLKYLIETSKCGSITKASQKLHLSPGALSISLKKLEEELNISLFERNSKGVKITDDGYAVIKASVEFFNKIDAIISKQSIDNPANISGKISLMLSRGTFETYLSDIINNFFNAYPNISIDFDEFTTEKSISDFANSNYDIGFIIGKKPVIGDLNVTYHHLFNCQTAAIFASNDPTSKFKSLPASYLKKYDYVITANRNTDQISPEYKVLNSLNYEPANIYYANNFQFIHDLIIGKKCTTLTYINPSMKINTFSRFPDLVAVPIKDIAPLPFGYILHSDKSLSVASHHFLKYLKSYLSLHRIT